MIRKQASDAFSQTPLQEVLQSQGIKKLVISGVMTEFCVDITCRRAISLEYDVVLVADAHLTGDNGILSASQIVAHHNHVLAKLAHPTHSILVQPAADVQSS